MVKRVVLKSKHQITSRSIKDLRLNIIIDIDIIKQGNLFVQTDDERIALTVVNK